MRLTSFTYPKYTCRIPDQIVITTTKNDNKILMMSYFINNDKTGTCYVWFVMCYVACVCITSTTAVKSKEDTVPKTHSKITSVIVFNFLQSIFLKNKTIEWYDIKKTHDCFSHNLFHKNYNVPQQIKLQY